MRMWEIWVEGWGGDNGTEGRSCPAVKLGVIASATFDEAVQELTPTLSKPEWVERHKDGYWTYWGCRIFDNEVDARRAYG